MKTQIGPIEFAHPVSDLNGSTNSMTKDLSAFLEYFRLNPACNLILQAYQNYPTLGLELIINHTTKIFISDCGVILSNIQSKCILKLFTQALHFIYFSIADSKEIYLTNYYVFTLSILMLGTQISGCQVSILKMIPGRWEAWSSLELKFKGKIRFLFTQGQRLNLPVNTTNNRTA